MSISRLRRALLAVAIGAVPIAAGGGAIAVATTPPPVPTVTPTVTPEPPSSYTMCLDPSPASANQPAYLTAYAKNRGTSVLLSWGVATGPVLMGPCMQMPTRWRLYVDGEFLTEVNGDFFTNYTVEGTKPGETHTYRVESVNNTQYWSPRETTLTITETDTPPTPSPVPNGATPTPTPSPTPTPVATTVCTDRTPLITFISTVPVGVQVNLEATWKHPPLCDQGIDAYKIYVDDQLIGQQPASAGWTFRYTGLALDKEYRLRVDAVVGTQVFPSAEKTFRTGSGVPPTPTPTATPNLARFSYALQGSTTINTLTKGSMPLTGTIDAQLNVATGDYTAQTVINDTQGRLTALGFLPVTVGVGIVPSGPTTGKLVDDQLTANLKARIKVKSVKAFGAIPIAGGNDCQSKQLSDIDLKSSGSFDPTGAGGTLAGTYAISDLNGCGLFGGLVSSLTAGAGNTISVKLTPKAG